MLYLRRFSTSLSFCVYYKMFLNVNLQLSLLLVSLPMVLPHGLLLYVIRKRATTMPCWYLLCCTWCVCSWKTVGKLWSHDQSSAVTLLDDLFYVVYFVITWASQKVRSIMGHIGSKQSLSAYQILWQSNDSSAVCSGCQGCCHSNWVGIDGLLPFSSNDENLFGLNPVLTTYVTMWTVLVTELCTARTVRYYTELSYHFPTTVYLCQTNNGFGMICLVCLIYQINNLQISMKLGENTYFSTPVILITLWVNIFEWVDESCIIPV